MYTVIVPRADVTAAEVVDALHDGLGPRYNVLPGMRQTRAPFSEPVPGPPDTIVVGTDANRIRRAQITLIRRPDHTELQISPGGLVSDLVFNALGIARRTHRVLTKAPPLGGAG